jgi:hypothetical protein
MWSAYTTDRSCSTCKAVIGLSTSSMGLRLSAAIDADCSDVDPGGDLVRLNPRYAIHPATEPAASSISKTSRYAT